MITENELVNLLEGIAIGESTENLQTDLKDLATEPDPDSGVAWVRDGMVFVRDPVGGDSFATITPRPGAELLVNGVLQENSVQVSSADRIEIRLAEQEFPGKCRLEISEDRMEAGLTINPARIASHKLLHQKPQRRLVLKTVVTERLESPLNFEQLREILHKANVVVGLDFSGAIRLIYNPEQARVTVARGTPPEPPVDEKVEVLFPLDFKLVPVVKEDGKADFHNIKNVISVEEGALLACKKPGSPGKPGLNVCGEVVPPPQPRRVMLRAGKGAVLSAEGDKVFAGRTGRPVYRKAGQIHLVDVENVLIHEGDVDVGTGNVRFKGSLLVVRGNVLESMTVQATGIAAISGIVSGARVVAYENISIGGNTTNSVVSAGIAEEILQYLRSLIDSLEKGFDHVVKIIGVLASLEKVKNAGVGYGYLFKLVLEKKQTDIPEAMERLQKMLKSSFADLPGEVEEVVLLAGRIMADPYHFAGKEELLKLLKGLGFIRDYFTDRSTLKANLDIVGTVNCQLFATGDVTIHSQGCFNTTVQAGGDIKIGGVFRGGEIRAGGNITISEAGTERGVKTVIEAGVKSVVRIHRCHGGVTIKLGLRMCRVMDKVNGLVAALDKAGDLVCNSSKVKIG